MPQTDDILIADSYAVALLELTESKGVSAEVLEELGELVSGMDREPALRDLLTSPTVDDEGRSKVMESAFRGRMSDLLLNTLLVMNDKGRLAIVETLLERFRLAIGRARGQVDVRVTSAVALSAGGRSELSAALEKITGKTPILVERIDASLLGGLVIQIGDKKLDGSVATRLANLRAALADRASREVHSGKEYVEGMEAWSGN